MAEELRVFMDLISSSSESSDEELFDILLGQEKRETPKIKNFVEDVVNEYTNKVVVLKTILIDYTFQLLLIKILNFGSFKIIFDFLEILAIS